MKFPVWSTVVEAFDYCWRERRAMVRFGWIPTVIVIAVSIALTGLMMRLPLQSDTDQQKQVVRGIAGLIQAVVFLSVSVTWYQKVVLGDDAAAQRPMFTLGQLEMRLLGWQILAILAFVVVGTAGAIAIAAIYGVVAAGGQEIAAIIVAMVLGGALLLAILFTAMRLAMVLVLVALDKPVKLRAAWHMTDGLGWRLCGAIMLVTISSLILTAIGYLVGMLFGMIGGIALGTTADNVATFINIVFESVTGLLIFLVGATVFGFVYRLVTTHAETTLQAETL